MLPRAQNPDQVRRAAYSSHVLPNRMPLTQKDSHFEAAASALQKTLLIKCLAQTYSFKEGASCEIIPPVSSRSDSNKRAAPAIGNGFPQDLQVLLHRLLKPSKVDPKGCLKAWRMVAVRISLRLYSTSQLFVSERRSGDKRRTQKGVRLDSGRSP